MQTILVIDDDASICECLSMYLSEEGYDAVTANTGREGLDAFSKSRADLVILDVRLPDIDGFEVLKGIKGESRDVPVIMISAFHDPDSVAKAMKGGAFAYIRKPVSIVEMEQAIGDALKK
jgi:DNA-binding NtrC family response regulator